VTENLNRRDFLRRAAKAGISIAAAGSLGLWLYDGVGPRRGEGEGDLVRVPDFSLPEVGRRMAVVTGSSRRETVGRAIEALGGMEVFIKKGDRVLLKVNAAFASPPVLSATTNPELLAEVAALCFKAGAASVVVSDNPINDPVSCFALSGIAEAARSAGAKVVLPTAAAFRTTTVPGTTLLRDWPILWEPLQGITKLIGLAPVKNHHRSGASMAMKNWYGLLGGRRNIFHQDINTIIKDLALMVRPTLVILDGTTTMMTNGPTGGSIADLKQTNTMIVSTDQVAADAFGATLLGMVSADLPFIIRAAAAGIGTADFESLRPVRLSVG
jgi:uncharacterized protein (DUF362 family)